MKITTNIRSEISIKSIVGYIVKMNMKIAINIRTLVDKNSIKTERKPLGTKQVRNI